MRARTASWLGLPGLAGVPEYGEWLLLRDGKESGLLFACEQAQQQSRVQGALDAADSKVHLPGVSGQVLQRPLPAGPSRGATP